MLFLDLYLYFDSGLGLVSASPRKDRAQYPTNCLMPTIATGAQCYLMYADPTGAGQKEGGGQKPLER